MTKKSKSDEVPPARTLAQLERLARLTRSASHTQGLNAAQWEALRYLSRCNRFSNSPMALAHYLGATKGTVSQTVAALVKKNVITKVTRSGNGRSVVLMLTDQGEKILDDDPLLDLAEAIRNLGGKTQRRFARGIDELLSSERQRQNQPAFGACQNCRYFREKGSGETLAPHLCMKMEQALSEAESKLICVEQVEA
jgi:DNA-binding MarR family transcriptional regulator